MTESIFCGIINFIRSSAMQGYTDLEEKTEMETEKEKTGKGWLIPGACVIVFLAAMILWKAGIFGVPKSGLEKDVREAMKIDSTWESAQAVNGDLSAMIFYSPGQKDYTYAVYLNRDGFSFGYFFREGGMEPYIEEGVQEIIYEDKVTVFLSMNTEGISRIVADNGLTTQTIEVDADKPFAAVLPVDCGEITLYDASGNIVDGKLYDRYTG